MKIFLCLTILFHICFCQRGSERSKNVWRIIVDDDVRNGHQEPIERPCHIHDVNCIRRYFAQNFKCSPTHGPTPDPYRMKTLPLPLGYSNITFTLNNFQVKGLNNWKIKEFYINKETDKMVLEVEFDNIVVYSDASEVAYYRKGKEPIIVSDYSIIEYRSVSLTMTIPNVKDLNLSGASVYAYLPDAHPKYGMGPKFRESKEPVVQKMNSRMLHSIDVSIREGFVIQGPLFMYVFLQNSICDFNPR